MALLFLSCFLAATLLAAVLLRGKTDRAWRRAARALDLQYFPPSLVAPRRIAGTIGAFSVEIAMPSGKRGGGTGLRVYGEALPASLSIRAETAWTNLKKAVSGEDVQLRDEDFDGQVNIHGPDELVFALMDSETRRSVRDLVAEGAVVACGQVELVRSGAIRDADTLVHLVTAMTRLAGRLSRGPVAHLLAQNAQIDPRAAVRARNLEVLAQGYPASDEARRAGRAVLKDSDLKVRRLGAALERGPAGMKVLAAMSADRHAPVEDRVSALEQLVAAYSYGQSKAVVVEALASPEAELKRAALLAIGEARDREQLDCVCALASTADPRVAEAVVRALGRIGDTRAEPALLELLGSTTAKVRCAAAKLLGPLGTIRAVEPLVPLARGVLVDAELRQAAQDALRVIQAKLGDVAAGRLSVAKVEDSIGAVSVAPDLGGEVSLAREESSGAAKPVRG